jgi:hypothetical protein
VSTTTALSFDEALKKFEQAQESYASWGAWDTEPRAVFRDLIEATYEGREVEVPTTVSGWQLYSDMKGNGLAAAALTRAARRAIEAARHDTLGVARYVRDCW